MGNTLLGNSQFGKISEDTVHLSVWADWGMDASELFERLQYYQNEARRKVNATITDVDAGNEGDMELDFDPDNLIPVDNAESSSAYDDAGAFNQNNDDFPFGGCLWKMRCHGMGGKDGRAYYPYQIVSGGVTIGFRREKHETVSNMWIEIGSIPLARLGGLENAWNDLANVFKSEGIIIVKELVSRVDIYADFDDCDVEEFCKRFYDNFRITRARKIGNYGEELNTAVYLSGRKYTGFSVGQNIKLRCYDKRHELRNDPVKWAVFADKYGEIPEVLTRVEFQLRRAALKDFSFPDISRIDGVETYMKAREMLWRYLTESWFRLTEDKVDAKNNHQSRAKTWRIWERVQTAAAATMERVKRIKTRVLPKLNSLFNMGLSCAIKAAVWECEEQIATPMDFAKFFFERLKAMSQGVFEHMVAKHYGDKLAIAGFNSNYWWG